jgi:hypothetical protein
MSVLSKYNRKQKIRAKQKRQSKLRGAIITAQRQAKNDALSGRPDRTSIHHISGKYRTQFSLNKVELAYRQAYLQASIGA